MKHLPWHNLILPMVFMVLVSTAGPAVAGDRDGPMIDGNPLSDLPSEPGPHIEKIKQLKGGEWLNLGSPAPDEKWGRARGAPWGAEALDLAPDLRGAFRAGEGRHAYVKPNGFGQDDYWFYDLNAHQWICLYPGTDTGNV